MAEEKNAVRTALVQGLIEANDTNERIEDLLTRAVGINGTPQPLLGNVERPTPNAQVAEGAPLRWTKGAAEDPRLSSHSDLELTSPQPLRRSALDVGRSTLPSNGCGVP